MFSDMFQPEQIILITIITLLILWSGFITYHLLSLKTHYSALIGKTNKKDLKQVLEEVLQLQQQQHSALDTVKVNLQAIEKDAGFHIQNIGFMRFNPFSDTGGEQSFALALLDNHKNGIVFSFLHSRDATRAYAKQVTAGKCKEFPLSEEEEHIVAAAQPIKKMLN